MAKKKINAVVGRLKGATTMTLQSVIFSPKSEWTVEECKTWLTDHELKAGEPDETANSYRFRQRDPGDFEEGSFRTINFKGGKKKAVTVLILKGEKFQQAEVNYTATSPHPEETCD